jgi:hypothetical protein
VEGRRHVAVDCVAPVERGLPAVLPSIIVTATRDNRGGAVLLLLLFPGSRTQLAFQHFKLGLKHLLNLLRVKLLELLLLLVGGILVLL